MTKQEVKIPEAILFLYNYLRAVNSYYYGSFPKHIQDELTNLINSVEKEYIKDYEKGKDIVACELYEKITFNE